jgi:ABC-type nitrate/sulfonate/bicarbonate transport system ATPase subunit/ABC-type nitrate/sulfonate/bicarbonate transport system permease component
MGLAIGAFMGIFAGISIAQSRNADKLLSPSMQFFATIPAIVWLPFLIAIFGIGEALKISLVAIAVFFLLHIHTFRSARNVDRDFIELAAVYEKSFLQRIRHVILPSATPEVLTAIRIGLAFGWIILFFAEYSIAQKGTEGLGWFVLMSRQLGRKDFMFAGTIVIGFIGVSLDYIFVRIQNHFLAWKDSEEHSSDEMAHFSKHHSISISNPPALSIHIDSMSYNLNSEPLIQNFNMEIRAGETISLIGPSGAGKTTLLRILAGLQNKFKGSIKLGERNIEFPSRDIQIVFQDNRLMPWKSVKENVEFASSEMHSKSRKSNVEQWLKNVGLEKEMYSWPRDLSGGQEGRAAFARTFIDSPKLLLLDEPFKSLDTITKYKLQNEFIDFLKGKCITVVLISHSIDDAVFLSDKVYLLRQKPLQIEKEWNINISKPRDRENLELKKIAAEIGLYVNQSIQSKGSS